MSIRLARCVTLALLATVVTLPRPLHAAVPPLYPREVFFGTPERMAPSLSPDGRQFAWVAPTEDGVPNVWVQTLGVDEGRPITRGAGAGIYSYFWSTDSRRILYFADRAGDENSHLFCVEPAGGDARDLTPFAGVKAVGVLLDRRHPDELLVGLNRRDPRVFDQFRVNLTTGEATLEAQNPGDVVEWLADDAFRVRACAALDSATADVLIRVRDTPDGPWRQLAVWPFLDNNDINYQNLIEWGADGRTLVVQNSLTSNTSQIKAIDLVTGRDVRVIASDPSFDVANPFGPGVVGGEAELLRDPVDGHIQAVCFEAEKREWKVLDPAVAPDFEFLRSQLRRPFFFTGSAPGRWVVGCIDDVGPTVYHLYERSTRTLKPLFSDQPKLSGLTLAPMTPVTIEARDGLRMVGYLTMPVGAPERDLPFIINPHGGPWYRDSWGYNPETQWLANRGYAVLQVNFRGSTGFGKKSLNSAIGQWGTGTMQQDVTDAVKWAIARGIADPKRVGILGWSYGGYCALSGITFTPELYACAVAGVGPANVRTLMQSFPAYWGPRKIRWIRRVGDAERDDALNARISPLFHVDAIRAPLLMGYGANDPRVKLTEAEAMLAAMRGRQLPVTLVVYPDEGHGFGRSENNFDFYGRVEEFLGRHLGGRVEPWRAIPGSSAQVR